MINRAGIEPPLVVASRSPEFARAVHAGDVLTGAAVVELEPVRPEQAETYLRLSTPPDDRLARWEPVFAELRRGPGSPVATALSTPLMVTQARTVYALDHNADPAELVRCPSRRAIEDRLLDALVPALYAGSSRWSADRARRWLAFLAAHLRRRGTRDLAWWELAPGRALSQIARAVGFGLAVGILAGAVSQIARAVGLGLAISFPVAIDFTKGPTYPSTEIVLVLAAGISTALVAGIGAAIAVGLSLVGFAALRRPSRLVLRPDRSLLRRFLIGVVTGVLVVLPLVVVYEQAVAVDVGTSVVDPIWWPLGAQIAVVIGVPIGLAFGLIFGLTRPSEQPPTPTSSLGSNRLVSIITLLVVSLSFVLVWGPLVGLVFLPASLPLILGNAAFGLVGGVPIALGLAAVLPCGAGTSSFTYGSPCAGDCPGASSPSWRTHTSTASCARSAASISSATLVSRTVWSVPDRSDALHSPGPTAAPARKSVWVR